MSVPFILNDQRGGEIEVILTPNPEEIIVQASALIDELDNLVRPQTTEQIRTAADPEGQLRLWQLRELGVEANFDVESLEFHASVPAELRRESNIRLFDRMPALSGELVAPSPFSAYLNLRTGFDYVQQSASGKAQGLGPFRAELEGAVNLHSWVAEGNAAYVADAPNSWQRGDLRLVRDSPERRIRYSFGDLTYPTAGFQSFQPMAGLTVARNFSLQPYRTTEPRGQTSFFLKTPSEVEVLLNGNPVQVLQLPAGQHRLQDLLFTNGANDVLLRITDSVGRVETVQESYFFDSHLLARGEHEFSYSIGSPSVQGGRGPEYGRRPPALSLFHRAGLNDTLTAGLNAQGSQDQLLFGAECVWASPWGTLQPDLAWSRIEGVGSGYAARLGYRFQSRSQPWHSAWALSAQYRSRSFASLGAATPDNIVAWNIAARYSQRLFWGVDGGVGLNWQIRRDHPQSLKSENVYLSKRFGRWCVSDLTLDRRQTLHGRTEHRAFISMTFSFPGRRQTLRTTHDSFSQTSRAEWQYNGLTPVGGLDLNAGAQRRPEDQDVFGRIRYTGYRAEATLSQDVTNLARAGGRISSRTAFRFGTALVYADGEVALSRPVRDSFAIISSHPHFKDQKIGVDPVRDSYSAEIDGWGPAVVPNLNSYLHRSMRVEAPELPPGFDLGPGNYVVRLTYKSGTVIRVGTAGSVLLYGILENAGGTPVSLQVGQIVSLSEPEADPIQIFTNRRGKFSVEGLRPGIHEMRLSNAPTGAVRFEIPPNKAGIFDIGTLTLPKPFAPTPAGSIERIP